MSPTPMTDLSRSLMRCAWAGTVLGVQGLTSMGRAAASFDALSAAASHRLPPWQKAIYQVGEDLQDHWFDRLPRSLDGPGWRRFSAQLLTTAEASLRVLRPDREGLAARQEWLHKAGVYVLVQQSSASLRADAATRQGLLQAIDQAKSRDPRRALWMLEGVAHGHVQAVLKTDPHPRGLLLHLDVQDGESLMLHLGLGMAAAEHVLAAVGPPEDGDIESLDAALHAFAELCRDNAQGEHLDAALEALGLVVRCFFPERMESVARCLRGADDATLQRAAELYWHGVGRAVYFLPLHLLPGFGTFEAGLQRLDTEIHQSNARAEARAGFAYAATLVNLGWPVVLERFLVRSPDGWDSACREGLVSAVLMRHRVTPDDPELAVFLSHRPASPEAAELWRRHVLDPLQVTQQEGSKTLSSRGAVARAVAQPSNAPHPAQVPP